MRSRSADDLRRVNTHMEVGHAGIPPHGRRMGKEVVTLMYVVSEVIAVQERPSKAGCAEQIVSCRSAAWNVERRPDTTYLCRTPGASRMDPYSKSCLRARTTGHLPSPLISRGVLTETEDTLENEVEEEI